MRETVEFRIAEERARKFLEPDVGVRLGTPFARWYCPCMTSAFNG